MEIQSLSICVPCPCPNQCRFCVSRMHTSPYPNLIEKDLANRSFHLTEYVKRMEFARDNDCNTVILTGQGEPLTNDSFLFGFAEWNKRLSKPFRWIELQTSGVGLDEGMLVNLRDLVGVSTISLSAADPFSEENNWDIMQPANVVDKYDFEEKCKQIKAKGLNIRVSLNMSSVMDAYMPDYIFVTLKKMGVDQVTFRALYGDATTKQGEWVVQHEYSRWTELRNYIKKAGNPLEVLPFGATRYSVDGVSTAVDDDCMSKEQKATLKYLILRPNCKLYTKWDDKGSLLF